MTALPDRSIMSVDAKLRLEQGSSETRYVYHDMPVSCERQDQEREDMLYAPCLVVEVLSPRTEAYDRGRKLAYYRECPSVRSSLPIARSSCARTAVSPGCSGSVR